MSFFDLTNSDLANHDFGKKDYLNNPHSVDFQSTQPSALVNSRLQSLRNLIIQRTQMVKHLSCHKEVENLKI